MLQDDTRALDNQVYCGLAFHLLTRARVVEASIQAETWSWLTAYPNSGPVQESPVFCGESNWQYELNIA